MEKESVQGLKGLKPILATDLQDITNIIRNTVINKPKDYSTGFNPTPVQSNTGDFGESMFDPKIATSDLFADLANTRGELLPWYSQLAAGTAKMGVLATTTFLNSTVGLVAGIGTAINEGRWSGLWDNQVNKYLNEINEASEKALPNYYTNVERDRPWYENIFTANFLGDKVLKNMGFTMGAIAAGALTGNFGSSLLAKVGTAGRWVAKGGNIGSKVFATTVSAAGEASIEALNAANDYMKMDSQYIDKFALDEASKLDSKYADYMNQLEAKYAKEGDTLISTGENGGLVSKKALELKALKSQYEKELRVIQDRREELLAEANENKLKVGNTTFALNQALLSFTNSLQFGRELAGGFKNAQRAKSLITKSAATGEEIHGAKEIAKAIAKRDLKFEANKGMKAAVAGNITKNMLSEGFEEGAQNIASNASLMQLSAALNTFAGAKINPHVQDGVNDLLSAAGQAITELFGTIDSPGWEEFTLGAISGLVGVPFLKRGKGGLRATWAGGAYEAIEKAKEEYKANEVVDKINAAIQKPEFINRYLGMIRHQAYQQKMDEALENKSEFNYEDNETSLLISDVLMFNEAGALDSFKEFTNSFKLDSELTDELVNDLKANTVGETGKSIYDGLNKELIRENINNNAVKTDKMIDLVMNNHNYNLVKYGDIFNKEELEELTWLATKRDTWLETARTNFAEMKETLLPIVTELDKEGVLDENGNTVKVSDLLNMTPEQFVAEMATPDGVLKTSLFKVLDLKRAEFESLQVERAELEKQIKEAPTKGKGSRKNKKALATQLDNLLFRLEDVAKSSVLVQPDEIKKKLTDVIAPIVAATNFGMKYRDATKNPENLKNKITQEVQAASNEQARILADKNIAKIKEATNLRELKKASANMSLQEREQALSTVALEKTPIGRLAENLIKLDRTHRSLGNLIDSSEFEELHEEEKANLRSIVDTAYSAAENIEDMNSALEAYVDTTPNVATLLAVKKESDAERQTYKNETNIPATPATPPIKPPTTLKEVELDEEETPDTPAETQSPKGVEVDTSFLTIHDYIKMNPSLTEEDVLDALANPEGFIAEIAGIYKDLYSGLMSDKEIMMKHKGYADNLKDIVYEAGVRKLKEDFKEIKKRAETLEANSEMDNNPQTFAELGEELEKVATVLDSNNLTNGGEEIRSDGLTEADVELLFPKGQGRSGKGNRFFKTTKAVDKRYEFLWDYLNTSGAFDFINNGKLADLRDKNPNLKVHFIVDKTLNNYEREGRKPLSNIILMAIEANTPTAINIGGVKYQIVGSLKVKTPNTKQIRDRILAQSETSSEDKFVSPDYSEIDFIYPGRIATSVVGQKETERDVVNTGKPLFFGVFRKNGIFAPNVPEGKAIEPTSEDAKDGRIYMMLKAADGNYYPAPVRRKVFTESDYPLETYGNTRIYTDILQALETLANPAASENQRYFARDQMEKFLYFGDKAGSEKGGKGIYRLMWQRDKLTGVQWIQISRESGKDADGKQLYETVKKNGKNYTVRLTNDVAANKAAILELVQYMEPIFQINSQLLESEEYVNILVNSGVFTTNLADYTLRNAMFTIKPMDENGKPIQSDEITLKPESNKRNSVGTSDSYTTITDGKGRKYKLYPNGDILTEDNTKVTKDLTRAYVYGKHAMETKALTEGKPYGESTLYTLNMDKSAYAMLVSKEGVITQIYLGDEYQLIMDTLKKYVASVELARAVAEELANKPNTDRTNLTKEELLLDLKTNGYNPDNFYVNIEAGEAGFIGFIYSKDTGESLMKVRFKSVEQKEIVDLLSKLPEEVLENDEKVNYLIAPIIDKNIKALYKEDTKESKPEKVVPKVEVIPKAKQPTILDFATADEAVQYLINNKNNLEKAVNTLSDRSYMLVREVLNTASRSSARGTAFEPVVNDKSFASRLMNLMLSPKGKTSVKPTNPIIGALGNNLEVGKKEEKDLHNPKEILIFANHSVEELSKLRAALKDKGIIARQQSQIAEAIMNLLGMSEVELQALDTDAIIGKINCK